jgi:uncharacterized protein (TIGR02145 family)
LGNTVDTIAAYAFNGCTISSLTLSESIRFIGAQAFDNNSLTGEIIISGNIVEINPSAFNNNPDINQFLIKQYRTKASDPEGYHPNATPPTYTLSPNNVKGRAPFGAVNAGASVFFMDDPMPKYTVLSITTDPATNSATINLSVIMDPNYRVIDTIKGATGMPPVEIITKPLFPSNPWVVKMVIDSLHGNGIYTFETTFDGTTKHYYNVTVNAFYDVIYHGNGHTAGTLPPTAHFVPGISVPVLAPHASLERLDYDFSGWAGTQFTSVPHYVYDAFTGTFDVTTLITGAHDTTLYAVWNRSGGCNDIPLGGAFYLTTRLSNICWSPNLFATTYPNSTTPITFAKPYDNTPANTAIYGLLYTWYSAVGVPEGTATVPPAPVQGICPDGWRLPTTAELESLNAYPASELKSTTLWTTPGTDDHGFTAFPAGKFSAQSNTFINLGEYTAWWASDADPAQFAHQYFLTDACDRLLHLLTNKSDGLSVRCVSEPN